MQDPMIPVVGDLIRRTPGCISLGQGVVWWGPPPEVQEMISRFLAEPANNRYQPVQGIPELRDLIADKVQSENGVSVADRDVIVTAGGNMAFSHALNSVADPGDEIILQSPYYFNHEMAVAMAGCRAVNVPTDSAYQLRPDAIETAITPRTRGVVTISPNNPTGAVYSESALRRVNAMCRQRGIYHIHDEAYEYFTFDSARHFSPSSIPDSAGHTISLFSLSKSYGFASWRIGYMVLPEHLVDSVKKIQDTTLICPPVISQFAALGALQAGRSYCNSQLEETVEVRERVREALMALGDRCERVTSNGAFYYLLKLNTTMRDMEVVTRLIEEYGIGVMPGSTFGTNSGCFLRISYGPLRMDNVGNAMDRLVSGLKEIIRQ
jgi:aspartate/methionine/tyrosine aminotransferase